MTITNPSFALHIWTESNPVTQHNNKKLMQIQRPLHQLTAIDQCPPNVSKEDIDRVLATGRSETGGVDHDMILVKETARVMLTTNVDIADRLITVKWSNGYDCQNRCQ